jgi:hypothetical protein
MALTANADPARHVTVSVPHILTLEPAARRGRGRQLVFIGIGRSGAIIRARSIVIGPCGCGRERAERQTSQDACGDGAAAGATTMIILGRRLHGRESQKTSGESRGDHATPQEPVR